MFRGSLERLAPVLMTSTFCEFLIHPGLFWKFSGRDAIDLAEREHNEEELLR